ncbi:MAG: (2Fe-2S)-binding protein [Rhodobacterales bacterium]|nr:MAG: (2Fe-2S)-binding protein [Rhodobacterales bacterium]
MIICSCQNISDRDIHAAIDWMRTADESTIITPGKIYHALGKTPDCGGCMKLFVASMRKNTKLEVPFELRGLKTPAKRRQVYEGRQEGH